jgi:peptidoglycan/LPS O-acetylase OafA/YrhL
MRSNKMPKLTFQEHSRLGDDYWHSIAISLLRGLAAFVVAAAHLRAEMYPGLRTLADPSLWFKGSELVPGGAHPAVVFFSDTRGGGGGAPLLNKMGQPGALTNYAIDRATRLWTVLIPTFGLTLLFGLGTGALLPSGIDFSAANEFSALSFAGNLLGLQRIVLADFGGNYALWSLANETWYYVLFPLLVLLFTARRTTSRIATGTALALAAVLLPVEIILYFAIWLLGVAFSRVRIDCGIGVRCFWLVLLAAMAAYFRLTGDNDNFNQTTLGMDLALSLMFLALLSSLQFNAAPASKLARPLTSIGKFFADFSFSLYVLHLPLIFLLKHVALTQFGLAELSPSEPLHFAVYLGMLASLLLGSYLSYLLFESQTYRIRRIVKDLVARRAVAPSASTAAPAKTEA